MMKNQLTEKPPFLVAFCFSKRIDKKMPYCCIFYPGINTLYPIFPKKEKQLLNLVFFRSEYCS